MVKFLVAVLLFWQFKRLFVKYFWWLCHANVKQYFVHIFPPCMSACLISLEIITFIIIIANNYYYYFCSRLLRLP